MFELSGSFQLYSNNKIQYRAENETAYTTIEFSNDDVIPQLIRSALAVDIDEHNAQRIQTITSVG